MATKILTQHIDVPGIETFDVYRKQGGYEAVEKALKMTPRVLLGRSRKPGQGSGGAGFPMGMKWSFLAKPEGGSPLPCLQRG